MDKNGVITIEVKDELWDDHTTQATLKEYAWRGSLSHRYNSDVKRVQLVRKGDRKTIVVWQGN